MEPFLPCTTSSTRTFLVRPDPSFDKVIEQLRERDDAAAACVFHKFARRLIALAHEHLDRRLRRKLDPEDVVQSVFHTVFRRLADGQFELRDWDGLWSLLTRITLRKCGAWHEHYHTQGRDIDREVAPCSCRDCSDSGLPFLAHEPTPVEALTLAETVEQILHGLPEREQHIVGLALEGRTAAEIRQQVGCTESKVYRVLRFLRERLEHQHEGQR
jgi:RNA polymerase sigma-70 factor (ECF subfamily)